jgi:hypothetical protein
MIVERVTDTLIMATIIVIIISGNGFIEITLWETVGSLLCDKCRLPTV